MLVDAFTKALKNLMLPGVLWLFLLCLLAYAVGWTVLSLLLGHAFTYLAGAVGPDMWFMRTLGTFGGGVLAWFMFPLLYPILISFFDDYMAGVIERRDYPQLPPAEPPFWPTFWHDMRFSIKAIVLNIVCLPLHFIPGFYYCLNGYLLGSQFFRMSAGRRVSAPEAEALQRKARGVIFLAGVVISFCSTVPLLNLAAPLLGVATMLHVFHALKGTGKTEVLPPV